MRGHTGGVINIGTGGVYVHSSKHKMNTNSSTEANIFILYGVLTQVIWTRYFLKEQRYNIHNNIIYQDNQSSITLDKNGGQLISKSTRYINIRCYYITDTITNNEA